MALAAFTATLGQSLGSGKYLVTAGSLTDPSATAAPATTTVAADIATLVADGASPTQAHVNTLNTAWGTFLTAETAYRAAAATAIGPNATLLLDTSKFTSLNQIKALFDNFLRAAASSGMFTS